jgi:hypothetical protein
MSGRWRWASSRDGPAGGLRTDGHGVGARAESFDEKLLWNSNNALSVGRRVCEGNQQPVSQQELAISIPRSSLLCLLTSIIAQMAEFAYRRA